MLFIATICSIWSIKHNEPNWVYHKTDEKIVIETKENIINGTLTLRPQIVFECKNRIISIINIRGLYNTNLSIREIDKNENTLEFSFNLTENMTIKLEEFENRLRDILLITAKNNNCLNQAEECKVYDVVIGCIDCQYGNNHENKKRYLLISQNQVKLLSFREEKLRESLYWFDLKYDDVPNSVDENEQVENAVNMCIKNLMEL